LPDRSGLSSNGCEMFPEGKEVQLHYAYLSLGSNIEPEKNLQAALRELGRFGRVLRVSSVWQSSPLGSTGQPDYLNVALLLETGLSAENLKKDGIASVETILGRLRNSDRNAPRTIDIDIMLFDSKLLTLGDRNIPDREVLERPFVAIPLAEIDPAYIHPLTGDSLAEIAARFDPVSSGMRLRSDVIFEPC
jgi:2-amino-4-hydroxy-6-hydroxymethyldihydropteridine diphosphokinase